MSPRPSYVSAAPFMPGRVPRSARRRRVQRVAVHRPHGDDVPEATAADGDGDRVARLASPQPLVELLLRHDGHAVHADDTITETEACGARGAAVAEALDHDTLGSRRRVQAEPRPRGPARPPPAGDQLVLH